MDTVFLSYASANHFFAQLASVKLAESGVQVWADVNDLQVGDDWKLEIDRGIDTSLAVIVVLSQHSVASAYVTYEWASAMGKGKPIIPILIEACQRHPKLEAIQYLDFSNRASQPWDQLVSRIHQVMADFERPEEDSSSADIAAQEPADDAAAEAPDARTAAATDQILTYLNNRGFRLVSFERIRSAIDPSYQDDWLIELVRRNPNTLRLATLKGGKPGLAKR